jgi:hypothetical protein
LATTNKPFAHEIDFLEAANILETTAKDKQSVGKDFFALLKKNQEALAVALQSDHQTIYAPGSTRDATTKLQRRLMIFKPEQMTDFTEDEDHFWKDTINALKDGSIAKKTVNKVWKAIETTLDTRNILGVLRKNITLESQDAEETLKSEIKLKVREVILSEHLL